MFDLFSWSHILILLVVALVVVGPKDLPRLMHMVGRWVGKARGMANEFKKSFDDMARQTELDELRKEIEALKSTNPVADIEKVLNESALPPNVAPLPEPAPEPRTGEFAVTEAPAAEVAAQSPATESLATQNQVHDSKASEAKLAEATSPPS